MSVINQMLKDLDKRQDEVSSSEHVSVPATPAKNNTALAVIITVLVTLTAVALAYLYLENQSLKTESQQISNSTKVIQEESADSAEQDSVNVAKESTSKTLEVENVKSEIEAPVAAIEAPKPTNQPMASDPIAPKSISSNAIEKPAQAAPPEPANNERIEVSERTVEPKPVLNISRKKLSPQALTKKKMTQAEQAVIDGDIPEAEKLFEEVLLLIPTHMAARKQLAALLYGRQSLQEAVNVLMNGIQLMPNDSELRIMLAKLYLEKGYKEQALSTLIERPDTLNIEYQSILATTAQSLKQFEQAKHAYQKLIQLQGNHGRWLLGLAISFDSLGEYAEAYSSYTKAIDIGDLSSSAMSFAKQRKLELGE